MRYIIPVCLIALGLLAAPSSAPPMQEDPTETPIPTLPLVQTPPPGTPLPDPGDPPVQPSRPGPVYLPIILRP